jgi:hypothetical protein
MTATMIETKESTISRSDLVKLIADDNARGFEQYAEGCWADCGE